MSTLYRSGMGVSRPDLTCIEAHAMSEIMRMVVSAFCILKSRKKVSV